MESERTLYSKFIKINMAVFCSTIAKCCHLHFIARLEVYILNNVFIDLS